MKCLNCNAEGNGPRFKKRHIGADSICAKKIKEAEERKRYTHQLAQSTHCVDSLFDDLEDGDAGAVGHFEALGGVPSYMWIGHAGKLLDLRKLEASHIQRLYNIRDWMLMNSHRDTPYDDTPQFKVVMSRIAALEAQIQFAREVMKNVTL